MESYCKYCCQLILRAVRNTFQQFQASYLYSVVTKQMQIVYKEGSQGCHYELVWSTGVGHEYHSKRLLVRSFTTKNPPHQSLGPKKSLVEHLHLWGL